MNNWFKSGSPWIWMTAGAVSISLISVLGLLLLIAWRGLTYFWPADVYQFEVRQADGGAKVVIGEIYDKEQVPVERLRNNNIALPGLADDADVTRYLIKTGNRDVVGLDFRTLLAPDILSQTVPQGLAVLEREENGNFYGFIQGLDINGQTISGETVKAELETRLEEIEALREQAQDLQSKDIGRINYDLERLRLQERGLELDGALTAAAKADLEAKRQALHEQYQGLEKELFALRDAMQGSFVIVREMGGRDIKLPLDKVLDVSYPNDMGLLAKTGRYFVQLGRFVSDAPREANTEGGVFPAIFGTVFMVLLMAVIVTPFGVIAAIYLHEYAGKNAVTKVIRIAVINLAGVPSIVYGVFGLGFFVYFMGSSLDQLFYPEALPTPTFGSPGVLWSALTLAILTLPVVIVSTEEGLTRIPSSLRQGSLALGATKAETLWRIVIPMASPAIMTGLILAVARAAGEVAPLMLVGVVKLAPTLPVDGNFPFVHLDRKFMHLGFHIYDVGFQSPNVEAARPLVYATAFLLVSVIMTLNITAIGIRNHLREKFRSLEH
ncbi:phosphate ABC transporter permease PstA [Gallaecimonas xiamenensis]|uniref:Phosphate transport system permease protein PstA n=1 Tax=Gallaecimonas xiamenensis 3-C-1 TaxID=745411 RepID=K2KC26_9GAMM|nr:phosphate ABC transporter permease PstA [Gallaecimonas xiamenensis]EKE74910.1 phosphate ABC transporter permease [Gallaecimonas xiamenensis 3-C-1]